MLPSYRKGRLLGIGAVFFPLVLGCDLSKPDLKFNDINCICGIEEKARENRFIAKFRSVSSKANIFTVSVQPGLHSFAYDENTDWIWNEKAGSIENLNDRAGACVIVDYQMSGKTKTADSVQFLPHVELSQDWEIPYSKLADIVSGNSDGATIIDSRLPSVYAAGSIPGAINIPLFEMQSGKGLLRLPKDKKAKLVFYCDGRNCKRSPLSARIAAQNGYRDIRVYHAGYPDWERNRRVGLVRSGYIDRALKSNDPMILIDIRTSAVVGHIPGAIAIEPRKIDSYRYQFPQSEPIRKMVRIVVYGNSEKDESAAHRVAETIAAWGYHRVTVLAGGWNAYKRTGRIERDSLLGEIKVFEGKRPGEFTASEFVNIVGHLDSDDTMLLDVREKREVGRDPGVTKIGAANIPLSGFVDSLGKLDRSKTYFLFSSRGKRAFTARNMLVQDGFMAFYISASISFDDSTGLHIGPETIPAKSVYNLGKRTVEPPEYVKDN